MRRRRYAGADFDYGTLLTVVDDAWKKYADEQSRWNPTFDLDDPDTLRMLCQRFPVWPLTRIISPMRVRYVNQQELALNVAGVGRVTSSPPLSVREFGDALRAHLVGEIHEFIGLSESDKTTRLLTRMAGLTVRHTDKRFSWIASPREIVVSRQADFLNVNRLLLTDPFLNRVVLRHLLACRTGLLFDQRLWVSDRVRRETADAIRQLMYYMRLAPTPVLLRKLFTASKVTPGHDWSYATVGNFPRSPMPYSQVVLRVDPVSDHGCVFAISLHALIWSRNAQAWVMQPSPLTRQRFAVR